MRSKRRFTSPFRSAFSGEELRHISGEDSPSEILKALEEAGMLALFSPALAGPKLNLPGVAKFEKNARMVPDDARWRAARYGPFLYTLTEKLSPKENRRSSKPPRWPGRTSTCGRNWTRARGSWSGPARPADSQSLAGLPPGECGVSGRSSVSDVRVESQPVQERLRNYFQKYLPAVQEILPEEWATVEGKPGTPKYIKARDEFISVRLDRRPKKPEVPAVPPPMVEVAAVRRGR